MAKNNKADMSCARVKKYTASDVSKAERHNERKNETYENMNVIEERIPYNVHFKKPFAPTYMEQLKQMETDGMVSFRGLRKDATLFNEIVIDVNTMYFERNGGYEYAKQFYEEAFHFIEEKFGADNVISAVMHADEINVAATEELGKEVYHYHLHAMIEQPSGRKKPYALYQAEKQGLPTRDTVARQAVDEAISKSFTLKDFDRELLKMGYRINFDPNRKYWTIIGKGWQRPKRLYKLGEDYTNDRIVERIKENSYAVRFSQFAKSTKEVKVFRVRGTMKNARKIGGLRGLYLHYCYKLGILPKGRKQDYAKLHYLLKDDLMKMEMIAKETRLLCRCHIDTAEQLLSYQASLTTEMAELTAKRKGLYSLSRKASGEEKEAVKAQISEITGRLNTIRKEVRLCEGIEVRSGVLKEKLQTIRTEEQETKRKELMKNEHRRRSGRTDRPNELGGL